MSKNIRHLSMALAVLMVLGLFTAFHAFAVSANDSATEFNEIFVGDPNCGDECAKLNVVAPTEVNVGDEFEMEFTWYDITYSEVYPGEVTASIDVYFLIDTRYIVYTGFKGIDGLESKDVENMCSGPKEGKDYGENYMQPLQIAVAIKTDEGREHCKHSFVIRVGLKAVAAGTTDPAEWTSCMLGSYPTGDGFTVIAEVDNENGAEFGWSVKVVDPNAESSEDSSEEPSILLGDVNGDGVVDNLDAAFILKYDAATIDLTDDQLVTGDVNKDGEVDNLDAAFILKYDAGIIESL